MKELLLLRYGEVGLKGKNRRFFENALTGNIKKSLQGLADCRVLPAHSRNFVEAPAAQMPAVLSRLQKVFGLVSISPVALSELSMTAIKETALREFAKTVRSGDSFKVETKRANKRFPVTSPEISREVGGFLLSELPGLTVDVHQPRRRLEIEIREKEAYIYTETLPGPGGLPVGVSGRGLLLISGGIDSPVAGYLAMKRGASLEALHFHSPPFTSARAREKVVDLCRVLAGYGGRIILHTAHFTEIQKELRAKCPDRLQVTLMRRMMFRVAGRLAARRQALALFTGENLGQVASQTMESLAVIENVVTMPVLRPLIGLDKEEIVALSKRMGAYAISIRPYEDCCTVFLPAHPATRPRLDETEEAESILDTEGLVTQCLAGIERQSITRASP
jgi:thiamine biosynthesis protein ThiI